MSDVSGGHELGERDVVVVSGAPGAGKSTLAGPLAKALGFPLLSKDVIKETIFDEIGDYRGDIVATSDALDPAVMALLWRLAGSFGQVVLEANFKTALGHGEDLVTLSGRPVEVYCRVAPEVAFERYATRGRGPERHRVHYLRETTFEILAQYQEPLGVGPVIEVDTTTPVDIAALAAEVRSLLPSRNA